MKQPSLDHHESLLVMSLSGIPKEEPEVFVCEESSAQVSEELGIQATGMVSVEVLETQQNATISEKNIADVKSSDVDPQPQQTDSEVLDMLTEFYS